MTDTNTPQACKVDMPVNLPEKDAPSTAHSHAHGNNGGATHGHADHGNGGAGGSHGHTHEAMENPGIFEDRDAPIDVRDWNARAFTIGIGGPVGSGKTALMLALCKLFRDQHNIAAITNDIFTREDAEFLLRNEALSKDRIRAIETGGCPHAAIREDVSANLQAAEDLTGELPGLELILLESGGDNLAANFSRELADYIIYVIDVAGGDKVPRKGGPGVTQSDLLIINKTDLAVAVGADLGVMASDAKKMRGTGPVVFAQVKNDVAVTDIGEYIVKAWKQMTKEQPSLAKKAKVTEA